MHNSHVPPPLKPGDTIGVMSPSSYVDKEDIDAGVAVLEQRGFKVYVHPQTFERHNQSAGTVEQKVAALHALAEDDTIKAVIFAGGGNRALHILDSIDFDLIRKHPKIYMGFSDCTVLLNAIYARTGLVTFHGPIIKRLTKNPELDFNLRLLTGAEKTIPLDGSRIIKGGSAQGTLIGGNFSAFRRLIGTTEMPDATGAILFLEDIGEELSRIDADLCFYKRSGIFDNIHGLIFGQFSDMKDTGRPFGFTFDNIVAEHTADLNIPVLMDAPFGHAKGLPVFPVGATVKLDGTTLTLV